VDSGGNFFTVNNAGTTTAVGGSGSGSGSGGGSAWSTYQAYQTVDLSANSLSNVANMYLERPYVAGGYTTSGLVYFLDAGNTASYPGSGSTWTNLVGGTNNMTLFGTTTPVYSPTFGGGSLYFQKSQGNYGTCAYQLTGYLTVEMWYYYTGDYSSGGESLIADINLTGASTIPYAISASGPVTFTVVSSAATTPSLTAGNWYHVVATYAGTTQTV
jgi:hypothetical protein